MQQGPASITGQMSQWPGARGPQSAEATLALLDPAAVSAQPAADSVGRGRNPGHLSESLAHPGVDLVRMLQRALALGANAAQTQPQPAGDQAQVAPANDAYSDVPLHGWFTRMVCPN
jgi:hypothetical protein